MYMCCTGHTLECWLGSYRNVPRWSTYSSLSPTDTLGGERERLVLSTESVSPVLAFSCPQLQSILTSGRISSPLQGVLACLRLLTTRNLFLLSFVFLYSGTTLSILSIILLRLPLPGLETSFWAGAFPSSVSFTIQLPSRKMVSEK